MTKTRNRQLLSLLLFCAVAFVGCGNAKPAATTTTTTQQESTTTTSSTALGVDSATTIVPTGPVTPKYGESESAPDYIVTTTTTLPPDSDQMAASAKTFLSLYWAAGARTYGQLADELAGVATPEMLTPWRDPNYAGLPAQSDAPVAFVAVTITDVNGTSATIAGKGTNTSTNATVWRTLNLVRGDDGIWRVASLR